MALKAGALKKEQMLSGTMADIFSNLYLAISVNYTNNHYKISKKLTDYVIKKLMNENQEKINKVIDNLGPEKYLLLHLKRKINPITFKDEEKYF